MGLSCVIGVHERSGFEVFPSWLPNCIDSNTALPDLLQMQKIINWFYLRFNVKRFEVRFKYMLGCHLLVHSGPIWSNRPLFTNHCYSSSSYQHLQHDLWHRDKWRSTLGRTISPKECIRPMLQHLWPRAGHCKLALSTIHHQKYNFLILNLFKWVWWVKKYEPFEWVKLTCIVGKMPENNHWLRCRNKNKEQSVCAIDIKRITCITWMSNTSFETLICQ